MNNKIFNGDEYMERDGTFQQCNKTSYQNFCSQWLKSWCGKGIRTADDTITYINKDFEEVKLCESAVRFCALYQAGLCVLGDEEYVVIDAVNWKVF